MSQGDAEDPGSGDRGGTPEIRGGAGANEDPGGADGRKEPDGATRRSQRRGVQSRAARYIACDSHVHLVSKDVSVINRKSPLPAFKWSGI